MQPQRAGAAELGQKQPFTAEQRGLDLADVLDLEIDVGCERHHAAGVDHQRLAGLQLTLDDAATGMHKRQAVAVQLLHDEALTAEEAHAQFLLEKDAQRHPACGAQESVFLADQRAAQLAQIHRQNLARIGCSKRHPQLLRCLVGVDRGEQRFTRDQPLACTQQLAKKATATGAGAITKHGVHGDAGVHEKQAAGLTHSRFARVEFKLDKLHLRALDLVVHHIHGHGITPVLTAVAPRGMVSNRLLRSGRPGREWRI